VKHIFGIYAHLMKTKMNQITAKIIFLVQYMSLGI